MQNNITEKAPVIPSRQTLIAEACAATSLDDLGDPWFFENLDRFIEALNQEARLTAEGVYGAQAMIVGALSNRLRHKSLMKAHPEIRDEAVDVAAIVVGLPRTGSTMLHRMLASAPGMTAVKWFEAHYYAPLPGERRGAPDQRVAAATGLMDYMLHKIPELMSIHPMSIDQPDEEVITMGQLFSSTMPEASYFMPAYSRWLTAQDATPVYNDLYEILQSLQWQDPERKDARWVLKTPGHLMALPTVLERFPKAKIVMTHRDPVETAPSYCSMERTLYRLGSDDIGPRAVAEFWTPRLKELLDMFMTARKAAGEDRFVDVRYRDLMADPIGQAKRIFAAAGVAATPASEAAMGDWIDANRREDRATHDYSLEEFALTEDGVRAAFADYIAKYL